MGDTSNQDSNFSGAINSLLSSLESMSVDEAAFNEMDGGDLNINVDLPDEPVESNIDIADEAIPTEPEEDEPSETAIDFEADESEED